jgi:hypothetical protein
MNRPVASKFRRTDFMNGFSDENGIMRGPKDIDDEAWEEEEEEEEDTMEITLRCPLVFGTYNH